MNTGIDIHSKCCQGTSDLERFGSNNVICILNLFSAKAQELSFINEPP